MYALKPICSKNGKLHTYEYGYLSTHTSSLNNSFTYIDQLSYLECEYNYAGQLAISEVSQHRRSIGIVDYKMTIQSSTSYRFTKSFGLVIITCWYTHDLSVNECYL
jgi:hypothetical protein